MIWDGASALVLDLSFQVKPRARMAKLYVHNTIVPGQVRTLLWSERAGSASHDDEGFVAGVGASSSSGPVQEMNYVPFVRFSTSTVYLVFEDVGMESSDDSSTDSYSVDVSLNGGDAYIGATVQQAAAHIQMTIDLVGVASADVGEHAQAGFKAVLNATTYNQTSGRFHHMVGDHSVVITDVEDLTDSRRRRQRQRRLKAEVWARGDSFESIEDVEEFEGLAGGRSLRSAAHRRELSSSSTSTAITFRLYSSSTQTVDVGHATSIMYALDNSTTLLGDLEAAMNVTLSSAGVVEDSLSSYDPSISDYYTNPAFYVFPYVGHHKSPTIHCPSPFAHHHPPPTIFNLPRYSSVVLDSLNPASGAITKQMTITLSGSNFVNPDDFDIEHQYARWILDTSSGGQSEWYTTDIIYR